MVADLAQRYSELAHCSRKLWLAAPEEAVDVAIPSLHFKD